MKNRLLYLDVIRLVACLMVVVMHSPIHGSGTQFWALIGYFCTPCVPLFFMVSGALLLPCKEGVFAKNYLWKRLSKVLYPTLIFSVLYFCLFNDVTIVSFCKCVCSIPFCVQGHGIMWFMYALVGLYLLVPIISPWLSNVTKSDLRFYLFLWLVTQSYPFLSHFVSVDNSINGSLYYLSGYVGYFLLGYYFSMIPMKDLMGIKFWLILIMSFLMMPLPALLKIFGWHIDFFKDFWYLSLPCTIMTVAWFVSLKILCSKYMANVSPTMFSAISLLANLTFGVYLIHAIIMQKILWKSTFILSIKDTNIQTVIIVILTTILSFLSCWLISKTPFAKYIIGYSYKENQK